MFKLAAILLLVGSTAAYLVDDIDEQPFFSSSQPEKCDVPPKYWCSSQSVARRCGVERQCDEWNSRFTPERQLRDGAKPVNVTIYFESLCPDCQNFFLTQVAKAAKILPANIMILDFVPFGNAKMNYNQDDDSYDFTCQHGPNECLGNVFETCATYVLKDFTKQLEYILCVENKTTSGEDIKNSVTECAKLDIPTSKYDSWLHCGQGHVGNALEGSMGTRTASLSPTHTFVPWVTFNGAGSETISYAAIDDLVKSVCSFYSGPGKCPPSSSGDALNVY